LKTALSTRCVPPSSQLYVTARRVLTLAAALFTVASLAASTQAKQPSAHCCPPTVSTYTPSYTVYGSRYYGAIDPYPIGYYPYASAYVTAGYAVGYYPYAQPVVAVPAPAYPYPGAYGYPAPYAFGYYGYRSWPWAYYGYPGWGWGGGLWGWGYGWPYGL